MALPIKLDFSGDADAQTVAIKASDINIGSSIQRLIIKATGTGVTVVITLETKAMDSTGAVVNIPSVVWQSLDDDSTGAINFISTDIINLHSDDILRISAAATGSDLAIFASVM